MATYHYFTGMKLEKGKGGTLMLPVGTDEAQTVTASKAGAAYGAVTGLAAAKVDAATYKVTVPPAAADVAGVLAIKCVGATDTQHLYCLIVDYDDLYVGCLTDADLAFRRVSA